MTERRNDVCKLLFLVVQGTNHTKLRELGFKNSLSYCDYNYTGLELKYEFSFHDNHYAVPMKIAELREQLSDEYIFICPHQYNMVNRIYFNKLCIGIFRVPEYQEEFDYLVFKK